MNLSTVDPRVSNESAKDQATAFREVFASLKAEIHRTFVGQENLVDFVLYALLADGHVLIEGVPGLGKTLLVRTLAESLDLSMSRIQFTPDLMPADITGTTVLAEKAEGGHELRFQPGPLLASIVLADEINRATPKTQSALLEAMQERQISVAGRTLRLPEPFMVLATQNPIEQEGTYALPEAQLDRFMVKLLVDYPSEDVYREILRLTTSPVSTSPKQILSAQAILEARALVREIPVSDQVATYCIRVVMATQPNSPYAPAEVKKSVAFGAGPRAAQSMLLLGKVHALVSGRFSVSCEDIRHVAPSALRHRLVLNFAGLSGRKSTDELAQAAINAVSELTESK